MGTQKRTDACGGSVADSSPDPCIYGLFLENHNPRADKTAR